MKLNVIYSDWGSGCKGGSCPTIYKTDGGNIIVQGYVVTEQTGVDVPDGETLVELPKDFVEGLKQHFLQKQQ
jgi:hypothetical protein